MLNRWVEDDGLLDVLEATGTGCIAFSPWPQGMLTNKYLKGVPANSRAAQGKSLDKNLLREDTLKHIRALDRLARSAASRWPRWRSRGCSGTRASALIGASSVAQLDDSLDAVRNLEFTAAG